jgi:E3 ubiquitin-protein ligase TRIP12
MESDISPFEVNHSGLIRAILQYVTQPDGTVMGLRDQRLHTFLHVFAGCPVSFTQLHVWKISSAILKDTALTSKT